MAKEKGKKTLIRVFTEDSSVVLSYDRTERGLLILKKAVVVPLPDEEASGRWTDPLFPLPIVWQGTIHALMAWIRRLSYVTGVSLV